MPRRDPSVSNWIFCCYHEWGWTVCRLSREQPDGRCTEEDQKFLVLRFEWEPCCLGVSWLTSHLSRFFWLEIWEPNKHLSVCWGGTCTWQSSLVSFEVSCASFILVSEISFPGIFPMWNHWSSAFYLRAYLSPRTCQTAPGCLSSSACRLSTSWETWEKAEAARGLRLSLWVERGNHAGCWSTWHVRSRLGSENEFNGDTADEWSKLQISSREKGSLVAEREAHTIIKRCVCDPWNHHSRGKSWLSEPSPPLSGCATLNKGL